jgi:hypothetical protein
MMVPFPHSDGPVADDPSGAAPDLPGCSATGTPIEEHPMFVVDVRTPDGELFRAKVDTPRIAIDFKDPAVGMVVQVEYDPVMPGEGTTTV